MRRMTATLLAIAVLWAPVRASAECEGDARCMPADKARKCLELVRAGEADLLSDFRACEAKLNRKAGAIDELRSQLKREKSHTDQLTAQAGKLQDRNATLRKRPKVWQVLAVSVGALLIGGAGGYLTAKLVP